MEVAATVALFCGRQDKGWTTRGQTNQNKSIFDFKDEMIL
jgi:hypothetical protein